MRIGGVFLLVLGVARASLAVTGYVQDNNGKAVPFVRLQILGESGWYVADANGRFAIPKTVQPPVTFLVYGSDGVLLSQATFASALPEPLVVTIAPTAEEVTVTAARPPELVLPPTVSYAVITQDNLRLRQPYKLVDVLDVVPNSGRLEEGHSAVPNIRGLARFRSLLLVDGTRVLAERRAGPSATFLDPLSVGEVQVVRGAAGVAYGSDAFGGVIAARTRLFAPGEPWTLRYHVTAGTGMPEQAVQLETGGSLGRGAITVGAGYRDYDRFRTPKEDEVFNSDATFRNFRLGYQVPVGHGLLRLLWRSDWGREIGKPALDSRVTRAYYPEENSHRLVLGYEAPLSGPWIRYAWSASWVEYQLITDRDRFATATAPRRLTRADVSAHDYNGRFEVERVLAGGRVVLGLDAYGRFGLKATNDTYDFLSGSTPRRTREVSIASARKDDYGAFVAFDRQFGAWGLSAGLRGDYTESRNEGGYFGDRSKSFTQASGFFGVGFRPLPPLEFSLQYSRGFRDAVLSDRFYRGITGRGFITGNPDLKPETADQWDAGLRYSQGRVRWALYAYRYEISDFIERYRRGNDFFFRNRAKAQLKGLDFEAAAQLPWNLTLTLGLQYPEGKILDDRTFMDDIPPRGGFVVLTHRHGALAWETRFAAYARDTRPGPTETVVPGYAVWDLGGRVTLLPGLELGIYGRNLLDRAYRATADPNSVLAPGRSLQLSLRGVLK